MNIAFVICKKMLVTSIDNPYELLFAASQMAKVQTSHRGAKMQLNKVAHTTEPISLPSGLKIQADRVFDSNIYDIVYLPALWRNPNSIVQESTDLLSWIRWQYEHGAILNATGTGVCFLAESGLLNHKPATTHWYYFEKFSKDYPLVELKRQHFITRSGRIFCAASINALTDLTVHHVHRFYNKEIANHLSQHFSHEARKPFEKLSFDQDGYTNHKDEAILQTQIWMQNHINKPGLSISEIASLFGLSVRNFSRRFKRATGMTATHYLQLQRHNAAKELLQNSSMSIKEVAYKVGYIDVSYFTKIFKLYASTTPKQYQKTVRTKHSSASG